MNGKWRWVAAALALGACEDAGDVKVVRSPEQMARISSDSVAAIVQGEPPALIQPDTFGAGEARPFSITAVGGSAVVAEAIVAPRGEQTQIVVQIEQAPADAMLQASVRRGSCAAGGEPVATLEAVRYVGDGPTVAQLLIPVDPVEVFGGGYFVQIVDPGPPVGSALACAPIPSPITPGPGGAIPPSD